MATWRIKRGLILARVRRGEDPGFPVQDGQILPGPPRFSVFPVLGEQHQPAQREQPTLGQFYWVHGVVIEKSDKPGFEYRGERCILKLSDEALSALLEYLYRKGTQEVYAALPRKEVEKIAVLRDEEEM